jgi:hypothetical protein
MREREQDFDFMYIRDRYPVKLGAQCQQVVPLACNNSQRSTDPTGNLEPSFISTDTRLNLLHNNTPKPLPLAKR